MCTVCTAIFFHFFCKINDFSVPPETVELIWIYTNDQPLRTISLDIWTSRINPLCVFKETLLNPARHSQRLEWNAPHACWLDLFSCDRNPFSWINLLILKPLNHSLPFRPFLKNDQNNSSLLPLLCKNDEILFCFAARKISGPKNRILHEQSSTHFFSFRCILVQAKQIKNNRINCLFFCPPQAHRSVSEFLPVLVFMLRLEVNICKHS